MCVPVNRMPAVSDHYHYQQQQPPVCLPKFYTWLPNSSTLNIPSLPLPSLFNSCVRMWSLPLLLSFVGPAGQAAPEPVQAAHAGGHRHTRPGHYQGAYRSHACWLRGCRKCCSITQVCQLAGHAVGTEALCMVHTDKCCMAQGWGPSSMHCSCMLYVCSI